MNGDQHDVLLRPDAEDAALAEIQRQDEDYQVLIYDWMWLTNNLGWDEREAIEILDGRFQTYAFTLGGDTSRRLMFTREVGTNSYYMLGVTTVQSEAQIKEAVYEEACKAHALSNPARA